MEHEFTWINTEHETRNTEHGTRNTEPGTRNPEPGTHMSVRDLGVL